MLILDLSPFWFVTVLTIYSFVVIERSWFHWKSSLPYRFFPVLLSNSLYWIKFTNCYSIRCCRWQCWLENGRYGHAPIRYDTIRSDTSTLCVGVPATYVIRPGKVTWRTQLIRNGWHMLTISNKQTCALSQLYDWLIRRNFRVIDSWLLLPLPAGGGSAA